jgi:hypothetical protein
MATLKNLLNGKRTGLEGKALERFEAKLGVAGEKAKRP